MPKVTIEIPDELFDELKDTADALNTDVSGALNLAYQHFSQTEAVDNAVEGIERSATPDENLISFAELKDDLDIDINFHPLAMEELEALDTADQIELIGQLIERLSQEDDSMEGIDLVLKDSDTSSLLLSSFEFGDLIYRITDEVITIYHIALAEDFDEDFDEEADEEFDEYEEIDELDEDEFEFEDEEDRD